MNTGYETRLYPTPAQARVLQEWFGATRTVKNLIIEQRRAYWQRNKRLPVKRREPCTYRSQAADLKLLRNDPGIAPWLKHTPMQVLQQALMDVDQAYEHFYKGLSAYPTYYSKNKSKKSIRVPQGFKIKRSSKKWGKVKLPMIKSEIKFKYKKGKNKQCLKGKIKSITIKQDKVGDYYISLTCETNENGKSARIRRKRIRERQEAYLKELLQGDTSKTVGLDLGVVQYTATSKGEIFLVEALSDDEETRLKSLQAKLERQVKGSARRERTKQEIRKLYRKGMRYRVENARQLVAYLNTEYDHACYEDLQLKNLIRSARGTLEEPGTNVAQKRGQNRSLQDQALGRCKIELEWKNKQKGMITSKLPAAYTSMDCSQCGSRSAANRPDRDHYHCLECGFEADADVNAALNLKYKGLVSLLEDLDYTKEQARCLLEGWSVSEPPDKISKLQARECNHISNVLLIESTEPSTSRVVIKEEAVNSSKVSSSSKQGLFDDIRSPSNEEAGAVFSERELGPGSRCTVPVNANTRKHSRGLPRNVLNGVTHPGSGLVSPSGTPSKAVTSHCGSRKTRGTQSAFYDRLPDNDA